MIRNDEYLESKVMTATPEQLHLMIVDAAIKHTQQSIQALQQEEYEQSHEALNQSRDFVGEIISGMKKGEQSSEIIDQLKSLFSFVYKRLVEADLERNVGHAEDALQVLLHHRETWTLLCEKIQEQKPVEDAEPIAPPSHELNGPHNWVT